MNDWLETIKNCGFESDIFFTQDGGKTIVLHWEKDGFKKRKLFTHVDADACLAEVLQFALNFDAFINTAPGCTVQH